MASTVTLATLSNICHISPKSEEAGGLIVVRRERARSNGRDSLFDFYVDDLLAVASESARAAANESELRSDLLLPLAGFVTDVLGLSPGDIRHEGTSRSGRYDSMFGRAIIEYKRPRSLTTERARRSAAEQALRYLEDEDLGAKIVLVTDGSTWGILRDIAADPEPGEQGWLNLDLGGASLAPEQRFGWLEITPTTARRILTLLSDVRAAPVSARTITDRMGPSRPEVRELIKKLADAIHTKSVGSRTDALFGEWVKQAGVAYGIDKPSTPWPRKVAAGVDSSVMSALRDLTYPEAIFALHSYVGLASKLLACEVLAVAGSAPDLRPTQWTNLPEGELRERLVSLEAGRLTEDLGAPGLLGGDLFGWYVGHLRDDAELMPAIRNLLRSLSELAWAQVATAGGSGVDLLRAFYQAVVPRGMRRYLGEFFTPPYLAERVLGKALECSERQIAAARIIDPSCGSGTFLVAALRAKLRDLDSRGEGESPAAISEAVDSIIGFDINPISALMSQVNLILTIGDRASRLPSVRLNVYHADSILHSAPAQATDSVTISTAVRDFELPTELTRLKTLSVLSSQVGRGIQVGRGADDFRARLRTDLRRELKGKSLERALDGAVRLYEQITALHQEDRNGVWSRFIEHSLAPQLVEPADLVVGNPPWISWKDLPQSWKARSESQWREFGLWQEATAGSGVPLSDIAALLTARALRSYCKEGGVTAMLLPQSVLIADPGGRAFRRCSLGPTGEDAGGGEQTRFAPVHVDDFSSIHPFSPDAANTPVAVYLKRDVEPQFPVPADVWSRSTPGARIPPDAGWSGASFRLTRARTELRPIDDDDMASPWGKAAEDSDVPLLGGSEASAYRWGRGFETRGLDGVFFCEILTPEPVGDERIVRVRTRPDLGKNTKTDRVRTVEVEATFLWPLVKGRDVNRWSVAESRLYCIVPYQGDRVLTIDELRTQSPLLFDHLEGSLHRLVGRSLYRRKPDAERPWTLSGPFEHLDPTASVVMVRYIAARGRPMAAVASPTFDPKLGRTTIVLPNNKCNVIFTHDIAEAHYLAGWTNSRIATGALARFAASTGITPKALQRLPVPAFDLADSTHRTLAAMAQRCAQEVRIGQDVSEIVREMDAVVEMIAWRYLLDLRPNLARATAWGESLG